MLHNSVLVTGGAGYVGAVLVPRLLLLGYHVKVLDLYLYGDNVLKQVARHPELEQVKGDLRDEQLLRRVLPGSDAVVHLACISNDPSFELNPKLGRSINFESFERLVRISKAAGVRRFVYASSSSVYGVSESSEVTELHPLAPLTDYSRYKAMCEPILFDEQSPDFTTLVLRPATVCGYSPRQRFDLTVNILTNHAVNSGIIKVFGGSQKRPNIHIEDMVDLYVQVLAEPAERIAGKTFNAGYQNRTVAEIAGMVKAVVAREMKPATRLQIVTMPSDDLRSYHISSDKICRELGFAAKRSIEDAIRDLCRAFRRGAYVNSMQNSLYYNIKRMQEVQIL